MNSGKPKSTSLSLFTWVVVLLVSDLPNAIWQTLDGEPPAWLFWIKAGLLLVLILASRVWQLIRPVRPFFTLLLALMLALWGMNWIRTSDTYLQWESHSNWVIAMAVYQFLKLAVAFIMIGVLLRMGRKKRDFFLTRGELASPVRAGKPGEPPARRSITWGRLGLTLGLLIVPLTLLFFRLGNLPSTDILAKALPFFPFVFLFAATNAFSEEVQFRASLLGDLNRSLGEGNAIWITAVFFGFAHYFGGAPSGIPGVLITGMLGALFAWSMLGSRGILVPWFIHFCQNAVIYAFWAINAVN